MIGRVRLCVPMTTTQPRVLGNVDARGAITTLQVVLEVLPAQPRVELTARLPLGGALLAGCAQWWGVGVACLHDGGLRGGTLRVGQPNAHMVVCLGGSQQVLETTSGGALPGTSVMLPDGTTTQDNTSTTSYIWVWTEAPAMPASTETVRVGTSPTSSSITRSSTTTTRVDVALEYTAGCRRSHTCTLTLPITQPWAVRCTAVKTQQHGVLVVAALQPVTDMVVLGARMVPQPGYEVRRCLFGGAAAVVRQGGRLQVVVEMVRQHGAMACEDDAGVLEVDWRWVGDASMPEMPAGSDNTATFQHHIQLEWFTATSGLNPGEDAPQHNAVTVRLLGPHEAEVGRPVVLLWQIVVQGDVVEVVYDVHADNNDWQPCGRRSGSVMVDGQGATIEAAFVPTCEGLLQPPEVRVRNLPVIQTVDGIGVRVHAGGGLLFNTGEGGDVW